MRNNNTPNFRDEFVKFLEKNKKLIYMTVIGIFAIFLLIIFVGSHTLKVISTNNTNIESTEPTISSEDITNIKTDLSQETNFEKSTINIDTDNIDGNLQNGSQTEIIDEQYLNSQTQPEITNKVSEEDHQLFYDIESFNIVLEGSINKIKNSDKIDDCVCNYSKDEDLRLLEATEKEKLISSLDGINDVINIRETIYNNNHVDPQLANLLGHSYLKKSEYETNEETKLIDLKKSKEYFLKKLEFLQPDGDESGYVDVVISSFRIINSSENNEDNIYNDRSLLYNNYIEILAYSTIAQEINPKNNAANYYSAFIYHELYKNTSKNNIQLRDFFKDNAISYYKAVDVSSSYYITAQTALDLLQKSS